MESALCSSLSTSWEAWRPSNELGSSTDKDIQSDYPVGVQASVNQALLAPVCMFMENFNSILEHRLSLLSVVSTHLLHKEVKS
jgi:hypothetical protein